MNSIKFRMKHIKLIFSLIILFGIGVSINTSAAKPKTAKKAAKTAVVKDSSAAFCKNDSCRMMKQNMTGCGQGRGMCRMRDNFVDKDSDGINDNRCMGIGFGKQKRCGKCKAK